MPRHLQLEQYQEQSHLLDVHLPDIVVPLMHTVRDVLRQWYASRQDEMQAAAEAGLPPTAFAFQVRASVLWGSALCARPASSVTRSAACGVRLTDTKERHRLMLVPRMRARALLACSATRMSTYTAFFSCCTAFARFEATRLS
ncbi:hypothetical protein EON66_04145 [archaeon]|nr:MAG: hypothetical protein EON66_04145 [archaeon]